MTTQIAHLYATLCLATIFFQIALSAGAPLAALAPGGQGAGALPPGARLLAVLYIPLLLFLALAVLSAAGFPGLDWPRWTGWAALVAQALLSALHFLSRAPVERRFWGPLGGVMTAMILVVLSA
ncbi:hypothetical protein M4578_00420 [Salipiger sp. P9]|uniref:hypothetical protein n=1 Tax=Salipiger pentaromativorans TaxID=2943193 RepID=UPI0021579DDB|nr:hypothetical protein [Salipiger pentaromativorans]